LLLDKDMCESGKLATEKAEPDLPGKRMSAAKASGAGHIRAGAKGSGRTPTAGDEERLGWMLFGVDASTRGLPPHQLAG
jgi:hypothetical protein